LFAIYATRELPKMPFFSEKTGIVRELLQEGNFVTFFAFGLFSLVSFRIEPCEGMF
jgi:hypothetical protein